MAKVHTIRKDHWSKSPLMQKLIAADKKRAEKDLKEYKLKCKKAS